MAETKVDLSNPPGPSVGFQPFKTKVKIQKRVNMCCIHNISTSKKLTVNFFDIGGGPKIRGIWKNYLAESHGCILLVNGNDHHRFQEFLSELDGVITARDERHIRERPIMILFNCIDGDDQHYTEFCDLIRTRNYPLVFGIAEDELIDVSSALLIRKCQLSNYRSVATNVSSKKKTSKKKNQVIPEVSSDSIDPRIQKSINSLIVNVERHRRRIEILIQTQQITARVRKEREMDEKKVVSKSAAVEDVDSSVLNKNE
jgi:GTPase SAR1 family protein